MLDLVPSALQPVTMTAPANDDAVARGGPSDRRRIDGVAARVAEPATSAAPQSPRRLAIAA